MAPLLPVVAVSATSEVVRDRPQVRLNQRYVDALQRAGVIPVVVPPLSAAAIEARRIGALTCEPQNIGRIFDILEQLWLERGATAVRECAPFGYEVIARQMDSLLRTELGDSGPVSVLSEQEAATGSRASF